MTLDELLVEWSYRTEKGYPDLGNPSDILILENILNELNIPSHNIISILKEDDSIDSIQDLDSKVILDPHQDPKDIDDKIDDLEDLIKNAPGNTKAKIKQFIEDLKYIDRVNDFLLNKNLDDVEEIFIEAYTKRYDQYKIYGEYITKIPSYKALPPEGNFIEFFKSFGFNESYITALLQRDYQAGGKGVGPGEILLVALLKDTFKGNKGDITVEERDTTGKIIAGGQEIEIKAAGAQLSPFSRGDVFSNNLYKFLAKNYPNYWEIFKQGKKRFPYRVQQLADSLEGDEFTKFFKVFNPYFIDIYKDRADVRPALNKAISGTNFDGRIFENEMARILAQAYINKESIEGFLFLDKKTGRFDTFTSSEVISNIGDGKLEVNAFSDYSPRLRLKKITK